MNYARLLVVPFSGGIGSCAALWWALRESERSGARVWLFYAERYAPDDAVERRQRDAVTRTLAEARDTDGAPLWIDTAATPPRYRLLCAVAQQRQSPQHLAQLVRRTVTATAATVVWSVTDASTSHLYDCSDKHLSCAFPFVSSTYDAMRRPICL